VKRPMTLKVFILSFILLSCSTAPKSPTEGESTPKASHQEFSRGELYLATEVLTKIFDKEMAPLECVPDKEEAELLLRTIRPRMEVVYDDTEAMLDSAEDIEKLINTCGQDCTCGLLDDLIKAHQVQLTKSQQKNLRKKVNVKEINRCLGFTQSTFCQSELFKILDKEKIDFSFESAY
jgi:hypothetical protein